MNDLAEQMNEMVRRARILLTEHAEQLGDDIDPCWLVSNALCEEFGMDGYGSIPVWIGRIVEGERRDMKVAAEAKRATVKVARESKVSQKPAELLALSVEQPKPSGPRNYSFQHRDPDTLGAAKLGGDDNPDPHAEALSIPAHIGSRSLGPGRKEWLIMRRR